MSIEKNRKLMIEQIKRLRLQLNENVIQMKHNRFTKNYTTAVSTNYDTFPRFRIADAARDNIQSLMVGYSNKFLKQLKKTKSRDELTTKKVGIALTKYLNTKLKGTKFSAMIKYLDHPTVPRTRNGNRLSKFETDYEYIEKYVTGPIKSVKFKYMTHSGKVTRNWPSTGQSWQSADPERGISGGWSSSDPGQYNELLPESFTFIVEFSGKSPFLDKSYKGADGVNPVYSYIRLNKKKLGIRSEDGLPKDWVFTPKMAKDMLRKGELPKSKEYMGTPKVEFGISIPFDI
mgnify:CR=1 FL=1